MKNIVNKDLENLLKIFEINDSQINRTLEILENTHYEVFKSYFNSFDLKKELSFTNEFYLVYKLDIQIRRYLFSSIERFEISLKTKFAKFLSDNYDDYSIWNKNTFDLNNRKTYLSAINSVTKRLKKQNNFITKNGKFNDDKGREIFFSNFECLNIATLGNTIHLLFSLSDSQMKMFCDKYFKHIDKLEFKNHIKELNNCRNYLAHNGKIISNIENTNKKNQFINLNDYLKIYELFMGEKIANTIRKNLTEIFKINNLEKYIGRFGFSNDRY